MPRRIGIISIITLCLIAAALALPAAARATKVDHYLNQAYKAWDKRQYQEAITYYTHALRIKPDMPEAYNDRGNAYLMVGKYNNAIADYSMAIKLRPAFALAHHNRGLAFRKLGKTKKAVKDYNQAIKYKPDYAEAFNNRGYAFYTLGQHRRAIADYTKAIKIRPAFALAYLNRAYARIALKQFQKAVTDFNRAVAVRSGGMVASRKPKVPVKRAKTPSSATRSYAKGKPARKKVAVTKLTPVASGKIKPPPPAKPSGYRIARPKPAAKKPPRVAKKPAANKTPKKVVKPAPPKKPPARVASRTLPPSAPAIKKPTLPPSTKKPAVKKPKPVVSPPPQAKKPAAKRPDKPKISADRAKKSEKQLMAGHRYRRAGRNRKAIAAFTKAIELDPKNHRAYRGRGITYRRLGRFRPAIRDYKKAISVQPEYAGAIGSLAWLYATASKKRYRDFPLALILARRAAELSKYESASIIDTLAMACYVNGRYKEGLKWAKRAVKMDPKRIGFRLTLRRLKKKAGP